METESLCFCNERLPVGWYAWLIVEAWDRGGYLPYDPALLAKLARAASPKRFFNEFATVLAEFELTENELELVHPGLRAEYLARTEKVEKTRRAARKRWEKPNPESGPETPGQGGNIRAA